MKLKSGSERAESQGKPGTPFKSIKSKLYISFGFLLVVFLLVSMGSIGAQLYFDSMVTGLFDTQIRFSDLVTSSQTALLEAQVLERDFLASYRDRSPESLKVLRAKLDSQFQAIHAGLADIQQLDVGQENAKMARDFDKSVSDYQKGLNAAIALIEKRTGPEGAEQQLRAAGQTLEDFFRERSMNVSGVQLMRTYEQRYLMGERKAGDILSDAIVQIKNQMEAVRMADGDREKLGLLCSAYAAALDQTKQSDAQLQTLISGYRGINDKLRPGNKTFYTAGQSDRNLALGDVRKMIRITIGLTAVIFMVLLLIGSLRAAQLSRSITGQVQRIMDIFAKIGVGDYSARAEVTADDELGAMASSLNAMLDSIFELIQTREERNTMQASLMKLLDDVSGVADGDLSKEAEVTQDFTGAIADAFNFAIIQLRSIVHSVKDSTFRVSTSASEISSAAERLAADNEMTAQRIAEATAKMTEMAVSARGMSEDAGQSASVSDQALDAAKQGAQAVLDTIDGMSRIRDKVQETAKRIKRLGESSQEIGDIVQMINDIADRTSILAMNASIQAAMSGESGRGFAVVAEEVERLAQRSAKATKQITELVKAIQSETNETVVAMEETTMEVVAGSEVANDAGHALSQIETISGSMADIIRSISRSARSQAQSSDDVARLMTQVTDATQQAAAGARKAAQSITSLAGMADELRGSVNAFKLPEDDRRLNN